MKRSFLKAIFGASRTARGTRESSLQTRRLVVEDLETRSLLSAVGAFEGVLTSSADTSAVESSLSEEPAIDLGEVSESTTLESVTLSSLTRVDVRLTAKTNLPSDATVGYAWYKGDSPTTATERIANATGSSYVPTMSDVGSYIRVVAAGYGDYSGTAEATSAEPVSASLASISIIGVPKAGMTQQTTLTPGEGTVSYQWYRGEVVDSHMTAIVGATESSYTPSDADVGYYLKVVATGAGDYAGSVSRATTVKIGENDGAYSLLGLSVTSNPKVGETITATLNPAEATADYSWYRVDSTGAETAINATGPEYVPTVADIGYTLKVVATANGLCEGEVTAYTASAVYADLTGVAFVDGALAPETGVAVTTALTPETGVASYQWYRVDVDGAETLIENATESSYVPCAADTNYYLKVVAVGESGYVGTATATTDTVANYAYNERDLAVVQACGVDPESSACKWNAVGRLTYLNVENMGLESLDVSGCDALEELYCGNNAISALNLSGCSALTILSCPNNDLTDVDLTDSTQISEIYLYNDGLESLYVAPNATAKVSVLKNSAWDTLTATDANGALTTTGDESFVSFNVDETTAAPVTLSFFKDGTESPVQTVTVSNAALVKLDNPAVTVEANRSGITLEWTAVENADHYLAGYRVAATDTTPAGDWIVIRGLTDTNVSITDVDPDTVYDLRVKAVGDQISYRNSIWTHSSAITTAAKLDAPVLSVRYEGNNAIVSWDAVENAERYLVEYKLSSDPETSFQAIRGVTDTSYTFSDAFVNNVYDIRVKAIGDQGDYTNSDWTYAVVSRDGNKLTPPSLTVKTSPTTMTASWDAVDNALRYIVEYKLTTEPESAYVTITGVTDTSCTITGLTPNTDYDIRVKAVANRSEYGNSNWTKVTATAALPALTPPRLTYAYTDHVATVNWDAVDNALRYIVEYKLTSEPESAYVTIKGVTDTSYTLADAVAGKDYDVRVKAVADRVVYSNSNWTKLAVMHEALPLVAPSLSIDVDGNKVGVDWEPVAGAVRYLVGYKSDSETEYTVESLDDTCFMFRAETSYDVRVKAIGDQVDTSNSIWSKASGAIESPLVDETELDDESLVAFLSDLWLAK